MPNVGMSVSNMAGSTCGAPDAYTLDGPPDKITAVGRRGAISAALTVDGTISEYTRASRTRRAISCAYCAAKSTTRTRSCSEYEVKDGSRSPGRVWLTWPVYGAGRTRRGGAGWSA